MTVLPISDASAVAASEAQCPPAEPDAELEQQAELGYN